jgi:hypothetical protein
MISPAPKKSFISHPLFQLVGAVCFFLVLPLGIIFGVLHRLFGGAHRSTDRSS